MLINILKSKIHGMIITESNLNYVGSITIDSQVMKAAGLTEYEQVFVNNFNNGDRIMTYVIPGKAGSKICCLNGPAARNGEPGDKIVVLAFAQIESDLAEHFKPKIVHP